MTSRDFRFLLQNSSIFGNWTLTAAFNLSLVQLVAVQIEMNE